MKLMNWRLRLYLSKVNMIYSREVNLDAPLILYAHFFRWWHWNQDWGEQVDSLDHVFSRLMQLYAYKIKKKLCCSSCQYWTGCGRGSLSLAYKTRSKGLELLSTHAPHVDRSALHSWAVCSSFAVIVPQPWCMHIITPMIWTRDFPTVSQPISWAALIILRCVFLILQGEECDFFY